MTGEKYENLRGDFGKLLRLGVVGDFDVSGDLHLTVFYAWVDVKVVVTLRAALKDLYMNGCRRLS